MDTKRFEVRTEKDIDPTQYTVWDTMEKSIVVRYADKDKAEEVCEDLNTKLRR